MSTRSVRLPDELDHALSAEANRLHKPRSYLVREAVREYLQRRARQRFMNDMVAEMHDWLSDESAREESRQMSDALVDDDLDNLVVGESKSGPQADYPWWR